MDFAVVRDPNDASGTTLNISDTVNGLCAVRLTKMSDGTTQYQSNISFGTPSNTTTAFTFNIEALANYMIEAWTCNSNKLVPTAVKFI
ncbi:hypothetical protein [Treponema sp.]|uniref:hypothetical protein n=1 Tax=Treponema sp. TaxID=166 RepID=UPI00257BE671|nr:hypothetical protein [Treponema sp.]MBE6355338.1 hypothetical protein [Treponema sp.]